MINGKVHGDGIYFSNIFSISRGYSNKISHNISQQKLKIRPNLFGDRINCVALCEVIPPEDLYKYGNIYVIKEEDRIVTRFLLVLDSKEKIGHVDSLKLGDEIPDIL